MENLQSEVLGKSAGFGYHQNKGSPLPRAGNDQWSGSTPLGVWKNLREKAGTSVWLF